MSFGVKNINQEDEQSFDSDVTLIIDADEVAFQIAAAVETRGIIATNTTNEAEATFKTRTEMKKFLAGLEVPDDFYSVVDSQIAEDPKNAFSTVKAKLMNYKRQFNTNKLELYLYGGGNFRNDLPLPIKYKSGRTDTLKPLLLDAIRDYLIKYQNAQLVYGCESDDRVCQRMYDGYKSGEKIIGITIDKDATAYSGWLYNPDKMSEPQFIEGYGKLYLDDKGKVRGYGRVFTWFQCLLGDSVDSFDPRDIVTQLKGKAPRFGEKAAYNLLVECSNDFEALTAVKKQYIDWFGEDKFTYTCWQGLEREVDWVDVLQLYLDCARMRRWEGDLVCIRTLLKKIKVIE